MRIGILSDLHVDQNNAGLQTTVQDALVQVARERESDLLIVAGDISSDYGQTLDVLREIEAKAGVPCLFVPGNHDLWNIRHPDMDAWTIYEALQRYEHNLSAAPYVIDDEWVVIGDAGWYDFSFGDAEFQEEEFLDMRRGKRLWKDKTYVKWNQPPPEVSRFFRDKIKKQLEQYKDRNIILVTHVVPDDRFTVPAAYKDWSYFNAFLGSRSYGDLIREYEGSIRCAVFGHAHFRKQESLGDTELICNCLGNRREWRHSADKAYEEVRRAFATVVI